MSRQRYSVKDVDNSCGDPDCCGGPFPYFVAVEDSNGEWLDAEEALKELGFTTRMEDSGRMLIRNTGRLEEIIDNI